MILKNHFETAPLYRSDGQRNRRIVWGKIKDDTEGVATMCKAIEDMRNEAAREADKARMVKIARRMLNFGQYTYEDIADVLEVSVDEVKTLTENRPT